MAVLEAWSYELPVLITPQCNLPEGYVSGAAIRIDPTVGSISTGLARLFSLPEQDRIDVGLRGRELVESRFSWGGIADNMIAMYKWVLGCGSKPDCVRID